MVLKNKAIILSPLVPLLGSFQNETPISVVDTAVSSKLKVATRPIKEIAK
jgi:hypothetical protein